MHLTLSQLESNIRKKLSRAETNNIVLAASPPKTVKHLTASSAGQALSSGVFARRFRPAFSPGVFAHPPGHRGDQCAGVKTIQTGAPLASTRPVGLRLPVF